MAQNVTIAGASYSGVPAVDIPKTGGGTARFVDTSDANAASGDITQGKTAYVGGVKLTGTNTGGGTLIEKTVTANGVYNASADNADGYSKVTVSLPYYDGSTEPILPSGYTAVNYIASNGTQWINTEYVHKYNTRIVLDCNVTQTERDGYIALFGSMNPNYNNAAFTFFSRFANAHIPTLTRTGNEMRGTNMIYGERIIVDALGVAAFWENANTRGAVVSTGTADNGVQPMALFAIREGSNYTRMAVMQLFGAEFYEGNTLVRSFIPCKNSSNIYGLYETVTGTFFGSSGSGQFTGA